MADDFDPDAYLASKEKASAAAQFDPDAYLKAKEQSAKAQPEFDPDKYIRDKETVSNGPKFVTADQVHPDKTETTSRIAEPIPPTSGLSDNIIAGLGSSMMRIAGGASDIVGAKVFGKSLTDAANEYEKQSPSKGTIDSVGRGIGSGLSLIMGGMPGAVGGASSAAFGNEYAQTGDVGHAAMAALKTAPEMAAYWLIGGAASRAVAPLLSQASTVVKSIAGAFTASLANAATSAVIRQSEGQDATPTVQGTAQDILFGIMHGIGTGFEASKSQEAMKENLKTAPDIALHTAANDPEFRRTAPYNPSLIDQEIERRKTDPSASAASKAEQAGAVQTATALRTKEVSQNEEQSKTIEQPQNVEPQKQGEQRNPERVNEGQQGEETKPQTLVTAEESPTAQPAGDSQTHEQVDTPDDNAAYFSHVQPRWSNPVSEETGGGPEAVARGIHEAASRGEAGESQDTTRGDEARQSAVRSQRDNLLKKADQGNFLIPQSELDKVPLFSTHTNEHDVRRDESSETAIKITKPNKFGIIPVFENGSVTTKDATPGEYVERMSLSNEVFGTGVKIEGLSKSTGIDEDDHEVSIVSSQPWFDPADPQNPHPDDKQSGDYMKSLGFVRLPGRYWLRPEDRVVAYDARPDNFILTKDGVQAIDLPVTRISDSQVRQLLEKANQKMVDDLERGEALDSGTTANVGPIDTHTHESSRNDLRIDSAAYKSPETGEIFTGDNHIEAAEKAGVKAPQDRYQRQRPEYGFVTSEGDFVSRQQANRIAARSGQRLSNPGRRGAIHSDQIELDSIHPPEASPGEKQLIRGVADQSRNEIQSLGPGAASAEEFMQRYANIGASLIFEGKTSLKEWTDAMKQEFEYMNRPELLDIWRRSKEVVKDFTEAQKGGDVSPRKAIEQATEGRNKSTVTVKELTALKDQFKTEERGYKRAMREVKPVIAGLKQQISNSLTKAQGLAEYLRGMEKGSKIAKTATEKEVRANVRIADNWLAADQEKIREGMVNVVNTMLPIAERGRFIGAITRALKRPDLLKGDPQMMYKNAAKVMGAILNRSQEVYKNGLASEIKSSFDKAANAKNIDIRYKGLVKDLFTGLQFSKPAEATLKALRSRQDFIDRMKEQGKEHGIPDYAIEELDRLTQTPLQELPVGALEALRDNVSRLLETGRTKYKVRSMSYKSTKDNLIEELKSAPSNFYELKPKSFADPDEVEMKSAIRNLTNRITQLQNIGSELGQGVLPRDAAFEYGDGAYGNYDGWLVKNLGGEIDLAYNGYASEMNRLKSVVSNTARENGVKLSGNAMGRIAVYANLQMKGGEERMVESGSASQDAVNRIRDGGLTPGEMKVYQAMMETKESLFDPVRDVFYRLYNREVEKVPNHWPWQRDWEKFQQEREFEPAKDKLTGEVYDENQALDEFLFSHNPPEIRTTKAAQGFAESRVTGAKTPIKLSAYQNWEQAAEQMAFIKHVQPRLKMLGEIARTDDFRSKYGAAMQKYALDWLDTVARKGRGVRTLPLLDGLRKNLSAGIIGGRPSSQLKHLSFIPYAFYHSGGANWYVRGLAAAHTKQGQEFIQNNFAEIAGRSGSDIGVAELENGTGAWGKMREFSRKALFALVRAVDHENSSATALGRYMYELGQRGLDWSNFHEMDVIPDAQKQALVRMRRAVASPIYKDVPLLLSRGYGIGGSSSIAKTVFQFGNPKLDQWSNVRVDLIAAGIAKGDAVRTAKVASAVATGSAIEAGIHVGAGALGAIAMGGIYAMFFGHKQPPPKKEPESLDKQWAGEAAKDIATKIPLSSNVWDWLQYHESTIPIIDEFIQTGKDASGIYTAKSNEAKKGHAISLAGDLATASGVPGSDMATRIIRELAVDREKERKEAADSRKSTREKTLSPIGDKSKVAIHD